MTDALAGSAPRGKTPAEDDLASCLVEKVHEHQVVIDFITQRLYQLGIVPQLLPTFAPTIEHPAFMDTYSSKVPANVHP